MLEGKLEEVKRVAYQAQEVAIMTALKLQSHVMEESERRRSQQRVRREVALGKVVIDSQDGNKDSEVV
jgi:hypothetical protein